MGRKGFKDALFINKWIVFGILKFWYFDWKLKCKWGFELKAYFNEITLQLKYEVSWDF